MGFYELVNMFIFNDKHKRGTLFIGLLPDKL